MMEYLYIFGYEFPAQRLANDKHGWDDEDSYAFFIEAESPDHALNWGEEVSEAFCKFLYEESGWRGAIPSWKADEYARWIESKPEVIESARQWGSPRIAVGEMPDFATWPNIVRRGRVKN